MFRVIAFSLGLLLAIGCKSDSSENPPAATGQLIIQMTSSSVAQFVDVSLYVEESDGTWGPHPLGSAHVIRGQVYTFTNVPPGNIVVPYVVPNDNTTWICRVTIQDGDVKTFLFDTNKLGNCPCCYQHW